MRKQLLYYAYVYKGEYYRIKKAIENNEEWYEINCDEKYITILDANYPACFHQLKYPPWVIFYEGDIQLLEEGMMGVVGSREMSAYGKYCVETLTKHMPPQYGVVSGVAKGVDAYAHTCAIKNNRKTIGVIGCGLNVIYPKENETLYKKLKSEYVLISEYPKDTLPYAYHFPWRNRLIAALSKKLVVIEAKMRSGTMISVNEALELGKDVYTFPHRISDVFGEGCNFLIAQGCSMLNNNRDIEEL